MWSDDEFWSECRFDLNLFFDFYTLTITILDNQLSKIGSRLFKTYSDLGVIGFKGSFDTDVGAITKLSFIAERVVSCDLVLVGRSRCVKNKLRRILSLGLWLDGK